jgi:hypothetical protein
MGAISFVAIQLRRKCRILAPRRRCPPAFGKLRQITEIINTYGTGRYLILPHREPFFEPRTLPVNDA